MEKGRGRKEGEKVQTDRQTDRHLYFPPSSGYCLESGRPGGSVNCRTWAPVMISRFMSVSPASGSLPSVCGHRARFGSSVPLSLPLPHSRAHMPAGALPPSLPPSVSLKNKH